MAAERTRLLQLLDRLHQLEHQHPPPHERAIHEIARQSLAAQVAALSQQIQRTHYWRREPLRPSA